MSDFPETGPARSGSSTSLRTRRSTWPRAHSSAPTRTSGPGKVAVHGYGNIISMTLAPRELIHIDIGGMLWKDAGVVAKTVNLPFGGGLLGKLEGFEVLELIGPGQVAIQSIDPKSPHF
jgi:uncharacterized protein (AIM24 family)